MTKLFIYSEIKDCKLIRTQYRVRLVKSHIGDFVVLEKMLSDGTWEVLPTADFTMTKSKAREYLSIFESFAMDVLDGK